MDQRSPEFLLFPPALDIILRKKPEGETAGKIRFAVELAVVTRDGAAHYRTIDGQEGEKKKSSVNSQRQSGRQRRAPDRRCTATSSRTSLRCASDFGKGRREAVCSGSRRSGFADCGRWGWYAKRGASRLDGSLHCGAAGTGNRATRHRE